MSMTDIHHLAAAYALDAVDERERAAFEAHYPGCEVCRVDVVELRETLARLSAASAVAPSSAVKDRVMDEIARTRQLSPIVVPRASGPSHRRLARAVLAAAAAALLVLTGVVAVTRSGTSDLDRQLAAVISRPDARVSVLESPVGASGVVRVVWSPSSGDAVVLGDELEPPPAGSVYELWLIDDGGPIPMRVLDPAAGGSWRSAFRITDEPRAWGVTIEPTGGSPLPTGEIRFSVEL